MARIEKTVFISYRRKDISWALAVYQYLTSQKYDVFFDFSSLSSGDFEQVIISNIRARAHFVLICTPNAFDRCNEPSDWLRREIETAINEKRNIIPLFFDGFNFGSSSVIDKLTGKLGDVKRYNGLDVPSGYFMEAMDRLRYRYLNIPLNAVLHPVPTEVRKVVKEEQVAANRALLQKKIDIEELVKPAEEQSAKQEQVQDQRESESLSPVVREVRGKVQIPTLRHYGLAGGILLLGILGLFVISSLIQNAGRKGLSTTIVSTTTQTYKPAQTVTITASPTFTLPPTPSVPIDYIIQEGDTLQAIAEKFNLGNDGVLLLIDVNPDIMKNGGVYYVGQKITIPAPGTVRATPTSFGNLSSGTRIDYQVLPGDTLASIAAKFNSIADNIIAVNNITDANALQVGQSLKIPVNLVTATATLPPTTTPVLGVGSTMISLKDNMVMAFVPEGEFTMGSDNGQDNEKPVHIVYLDAFWIDQTEVTNAMYTRCVQAGNCSQPSDITYYNDSGYEDHPVVYVSWNDASSYCSWGGRRLPTEAEWEKAARGGLDGKAYPWGDESPVCTKGAGNGAQFASCGKNSASVGSFGQNGYGLYDMAGNVWEWVSSLAKPYPYSSTDGRESLSPSESDSLVLRGGSWNNGTVNIRSATRNWTNFFATYNYIGFRCAMDAE
jgi:formylglycine-generating enzyme required for sulfatase activity